MDIIEFKERYPSFTDDKEVQIALSDADVLLSAFCIAPSKLGLAHGYLAAHILSIPSGGSSQAVKRVKAGSVEVEFTDKNITAQLDWLNMSSYGQLFKLLITPRSMYAGIGMVVV